jgi:hypothetical protein
LITIEAPDLRIIDQELWDAVKRRQASLVAEGMTQKPWDRRRGHLLPKHLLASHRRQGCDLSPKAYDLSPCRGRSTARGQDGRA